MSRRALFVITILALLTVTAVADKADKKDKSKLPSRVLAAQTVAVVADPDAGVSAIDPHDNQRALMAVEDALQTWGKYMLTADPQNADLVIMVRKGRAAGPVVAGGRDPNQVGLGTGENGGRVMIGHGTPPPLSQGPAQPPMDRPTVGMSNGNPDDLFEVFPGRVQYPLDGPVMWRYSGKNALNGPDAKAVKEFRKAVEEAEKEQKDKKKP